MKIVCSNCGSENDDLVYKCLQCGNILQDKIANLNFFETFWSILESPFETFNKILRAEHKNYTLFLYYTFTTSIVYFSIWINKFGSNFDNLIYLILFSQIISTVIFIPFTFLYSHIIFLLLKVFNCKVSLKNCYAIGGWSSVPFAIYFFILIPIGLGIEGLSFFTTFTSALTNTKIIFFGLTSILSFYFLILFNIGLIKIMREFSLINFVKSIFATLITIISITYLCNEVIKKIMS
ncbi:MAG: Yip1 family protein [Bacteroidetes bacterium]|nr:Yip1 family protein [Bacteroidota bacterium]